MASQELPHPADCRRLKMLLLGLPLVNHDVLPIFSKNFNGCLFANVRNLRLSLLSTKIYKIIAQLNLEHL